MEKSFGQFLSAKRKEKKLTQKQLAEMLYVSESAVSKWEKDVAHPDISLLPKLAEILNVSEHELITSSIDEESRQMKVKAKKWTNLSSFWNLFFLISYGITILTCFIVNLAVNKTLSWFFTVLFSLVLGASFTTFPRYIKRYRLIFIPFLELISLIVLLLVCNVQTGGSWFLLATVPIVVGYLFVFFPITVCVYGKGIIKKHVGIISVVLDLLLTLLMCYVISVVLGQEWFMPIALPLTLVGFILPICITFIIRYLKLYNRPFKTGIILAVSCIYTLSVGFIINSILGATENDNWNPFLANFSVWTGTQISYNVQMIICLSLAVLSVLFIVIGLIKKDED